MNTSNSITAAVFSAFLKCPTKGYLLSIGEPAPGTFFAEVEARMSYMYKVMAKRRLCVGPEMAEPLDFGQLLRSFDYEAITPHVDCETAVYDFALSPHRPGGRQPQQSSPFGTFLPALFLPWNKPDLSDRLLICFGALALSQVSGSLADSGTMIYGDAQRRRTVRIGDHVAQTRQTINAIGTICGRGAPLLVLNRHCAVCDFQASGMHRSSAMVLTRLGFSGT